MESQEMEINTSDGDLFSEHLILEESLRDELPTVEQIVGTQEPEEYNEEIKLARSQSTESVCFDEIEEPIENSDKAIVAETPFQDDLSDADQVPEEPEIIPETPLNAEIKDKGVNEEIEILESEIFETELEPTVIEETELQETEMETILEYDKENEVTICDEVEKTNSSPQQTESKISLDASELSRKRKALVESDIPNKINKVEVSSTDSTISLSVLSGKINLNDVKSSSEEGTSSVEIIEAISPQVVSIVSDPSPDLEVEKKVDVNEEKEPDADVEKEPDADVEKELNLDEEKGPNVNVEKESNVNMEKDAEKLPVLEESKGCDLVGLKESCVDVDKEESYNGLDTINEESDDKDKDHSCNQADFSGKISPINKSSSDATLKYDEHRSDKVLHKKIIRVEITYIHEPDQRDITNIVCDDITDFSNFTSSKRVSDVSAGVLGDVSKNNSPTSTTSIGPFPLPNRFSTISNSSRYSTLSRFSTSSTSSTLSSASTLAKFRAQEFLIPDIPNKSKTQSPLPLSDDQLTNLRTRWKNSELLYAILETIDHQSIDSNKNSPIDRPKTPEIIEKIEEEATPKSVKRSVRKKKPINLVLPGEEEAPPRSASKTSTPVNRTKSGRKKRINSTSKEDMESGRKRKDPAETEEFEVVSENRITVGDKVFARWTDRKYYSGTVKSRNKEKWNINFDDGANLLLTEDHIIPSFYDKLSGQTVFTQIDDKEPYQSGIIVAVNEQTKKFKIDLDDGSNVQVSPERICFSEDQAKIIKENIGLLTNSPGTPSSAVSLENLVYGKRSRSSNKASSVASPRTVAVLGLKSRRKLHKGFHPSEDEDSKSIASEDGLEDKQFSTPVKASKGNLMDSKTKSGRKFNGTKIASSPQPGSSGTRKATPRRIYSESEQSDVVEGAQSDVVEGVSGLEPEFKISTPIKTSKGPGRPKGKNTTNSAKKSENSNIFKGLSFILACVHTPLNAILESSGAETDTELKPFTKVPFIEEDLKAQIISGGGTVYQHFEEIPSTEYAKCKLISNRPNRTAKYIQCIAAGISVLSHEWIINCSSVKKRLTFQELPIGWSIESNQFIEPFQKIDTKPFQNLLIYLAPNDDKDFIKFWNRVCSLAGGVVVVMENEDEDFQTATLVLAESDCPKEIVNRANDWNIPLLSTTWIVQSIIHGEPRAFDSQLHYSYNHIQYDD